MNLQECITAGVNKNYLWCGALKMYIKKGVVEKELNLIELTRSDVNLGSVKLGNEAYSTKRYWFNSFSTTKGLDEI